MLTQQEITARNDYYEFCYRKILDMQKIHPTVSEVCLYMMVTLKEDPKAIIEFLKEKEKENES